MTKSTFKIKEGGIGEMAAPQQTLTHSPRVESRLRYLAESLLSLASQTLSRYAVHIYLAYVPTSSVAADLVAS